MRGVSSSEDVGSPAPRVRFCTEILRNFLYQFLKFKFNLANPTSSHFVSHNFSSFIFFTLYLQSSAYALILFAVLYALAILLYTQGMFTLSVERVLYAIFLSRWFAEGPLVKCADFTAKKVVLVV